MISAVTGSSITLSWDVRAVKETGLIEPSYVIEKKTVRPECSAILQSRSDYREIAHVTVLTTGQKGKVTWTDTNLSPDTAYSYRITSLSAASQPHSTGSVEARTLPAPLAPTELRAIALGEGRVLLSWGAGSDNIKGVRVERSNMASPCLTFVEIGKVSSAVSTFTDTNFPSNTAYAYRVFAFNDFGESTPSNIVIFSFDLIYKSSLNRS